MCYFMSTLKLLVLLVASLDTFAQVKVDNTVEARYKMAFKKMKSSYRQKVTQLEEKEPFIGISIFTTYQVDTLNRQDIINYGIDVTIEDINSSPNKREEKEIDENIYIPIFSEAKLVNDTLQLEVGRPFPPIINHHVYLRQITSYYEEYYKFDSVLRLDLKDAKVSKLSIPIKTKKFLVNTSTFKVGQVIYGQVEFETVPYYYDTFGFTNSYIKKRLHCVYLFKVRVKKNST